MSASLLFTTTTVSSDGLTITVQMSGVSGSLSPASGITGFSVEDTQNLAGRLVPIASVTSSGSVVTINLGETVNSPLDDAIQIALATAGGGSNLTDTGGNTPTGQSFTNVTTNNSTWLAVGGATFVAASKVQGGILLTSNYPQCSQWNSSDGYIEFNANCSAIDVNTFLFSSHYVLQQDGVDIHDWGVSSASTVFAPLGLVSGLSGSHTYRIIQINSIGVPFPDQLARSVRIIGTLGGSVTRRSAIVETGDSFVQLAGSEAPTDSRTCHMWLSSDLFAFVEQQIGLAGAKVSGAGGIASQAASWVSNLGAAAALAYLRGGTNDLVAGVSNSDFRTAFDTYIANVKAASQPPLKIIVIGIIQSVQGDFTAYNVQIAASAAAAGLTFVDPTLWLGATQARQTDTIHLNSAGEALYANRLIPITAGAVLGSSYTLTGPSTGVAGAASSPFTIALRGGATFMIDSNLTTCSDTITLNDGGDGGTFTPSIGSSGVGPLVVRPCSGTPNSFTFTYKPASPGVKTLTATAGAQGWVNPAGASYTASAAPSSPGGPVFPRGLFIKGMGGA